MKQFTYTIWYVSKKEIQVHEDLKDMLPGFYFLDEAEQFDGPYSSPAEAVQAKDAWDKGMGLGYGRKDA